MRRAPVVLAFIALVGLAPFPAAAQEPASLAQGAEAYARGDFAAAAQAWQEALANGYDGARVHYNLANALYRDDRHGAAIAHYLAAATLAPRDPDVRANLQRALTARPQGPPAPSPSWLHALVAAVVGAGTLTEFALAAMVVYWLGAAAAIGALLRAGRQRRLRRAAWACAVLATVMALLAVGRWWSYHHLQRAVVAVESVQMHTGPAASFEAMQALTEGWMVRVLSRESGWAQVRAEGGARGWVDTAALAMVGSGESGEEQEARD